MFSINDELNDFKKRVQALGIKIVNFEKVGNGNMAAYKMRYEHLATGSSYEDFFWRHDLNTFEEKLNQRFKN